MKEAKSSCHKIDFITYVSDGEPTQGINLMNEVRRLKKIGIKTAIITNSSLIDRENIKRDLLEFDWVSFKVDSITNGI